MAYDAGMLGHVIAEINAKVAGGKVDKIYQPSRDEIVLLIRCGGAEHRLFVSAGSGARMNLTSIKTENPATPPMFCMMLRKHFSGARFVSATQLGFERAARLTFDTHDELGFQTQKHIICELMGRFSNIIITNADDKIIGVLKSIDFTTSEKRQVLSGMRYELPPKQNKLDPTAEGFGEAEFKALAASADPARTAESFIMSNFAGISPLIAREIAYRSAGKIDATLGECAREITAKFFDVINMIKTSSGEAHIVKNADGVPTEYAFMPIRQYGAKATCTKLDSFGELIDVYFGERSRDERLHRKAADIFRLLSNAETRITKKISIQRDELASCEEGEKFKLWGDLITANIYRIRRGEESVVLQNYWSEACEDVEIPLDKRLSPAANAQVYYKKYNKSKAAKTHLAGQIKSAEEELQYVYTVLDALSRADGESELSEIRAELYHSGYASKMKNYSEKKKSAPSIAKYRTTDGHLVYCGRNNIANDYLTTKLADRGDWWFHVKNQPGSHVVLLTNDGEDEPSESAFTDAAEIAAYNSKAKGGVMVPVDYTKVAKVKKPAGAKPGFVIYTTNWTAYVTPNEEKINSMKQK